MRSNPTARSVIEDSYLRLLSILDRNIASGSLFLMGSRPGAGAGATSDCSGN